MGLDISLSTDNYESLYNSSEEEFEFRFKNGCHNLSRRFCNFMCRKNVVGNPELNQIAQLLNLDISPIYEMEEYDEFLSQLEFVDSEDEKQSMIDSNTKAREKIESNINVVTDLVFQIIDGLSKIDKLEDKLWDNDYDTLDYKIYFSEFNKEREKGYLNNNFGQDLRNIKRFLDFAKSREAKTVWFSYG
jgi:hypothetical protein